MRTLILMRGAHGSGKSTFLKQNKLEDYTLSADARAYQNMDIIINQVKEELK